MHLAQRVDEIERTAADLADAIGSGQGRDM
jgi:hypothetical protein